MALRFRKTVKLGPGIKLNFSKSGVSTTVGPRGLTTTIGKSGVYRNVGIPGTGISYRSKVGSKKSAKRRTGAVSRAASAGTTVPKAVREWQAYTGKSNPGVELHINELGEIGFRDESGIEILDPELIAIIKRTPQYKDQLPLLKEKQRSEVAGMVEAMEQQNSTFIKVYHLSPHVYKRRYFEAQLETLRPVRYVPQPYSTPAPTADDIRAWLLKEANDNVSGAPWKRRKLVEQYVNEHWSERSSYAMSRWQAEKSAFDSSEAGKAAQLNAEYLAEYEVLKESYEKALEGDADYIEAASEQWALACELPVEIATQFEYRPESHCLMVDLDLPEIEDLPTESATQLANGNLKIKEKSQKALRADYSECVFGLAVFVAANLFNSSPEINEVVVSGYTQRRNKAGDVIDDYIYSIRFLRDRFYFLDYSKMDPEAFCMEFENRCNVTATKIFKAIEPFE